MRTAKSNSRRLGLLGALIGSAALALASAAPAAGAPQIRLDALANSTAAPDQTLTFQMEARNVGDATVSGGGARVEITLPPGLTAHNVDGASAVGWNCATFAIGVQTFTCDLLGSIGAAAPGDFRPFEMVARVDAGVPEGTVLTSRFEFTGGGSAPFSTVASATITSAPPQFGIAAFDADVTDRASQPYTQAGGHPYAATTYIGFNTFRHPDPLKSDLTPVEATKTIEVDLPPGFFGDPSGVDQCALVDLAQVQGVVATPNCPPSSQIGVTYVRTNTLLVGNLSFGPIPVFSMPPPPDAPARLGFNVSGAIVTIDVDVRSGGDYGLTANVRNISEGLATAGSTLTLWGVPADPVHDPERACPGRFNPWQGGATCMSGAPQTAFLRNPTSCMPPGIGLPTTLRTDSWVDPGDFRERTIFSHLPEGYPYPESQWGAQQGPTGCEDVPFNPTVRIEPTVTTADSPSGLVFDLSLPQSSDPDTVGTSDLRKAVVTLPKGMSVNPSSANGLGSCSSAEIALDSEAPAQCPPSSRIGEVQIETPALEDPLEGSVFLAKQGDNKFGSLLALYLAVEGQGVVVKLAGHVEAQGDGQLVTTFDNQPQVPFSNLHLELYDGPRAPLRTPAACGEYAAQAQLTPWSGGAAVDIASPFTISSGPSGGACGNPFDPKLSAGTSSPIAGSTSPFNVRLTRDDGSQELSSIDIAPPQGLTAFLKGVDYGEQVGTVQVGAGAGTNPFYVTNGKVTLEGPYKGAPLSLLFSVPAVAGPFDLGVVNVRAALHINRQTAQITADADPMPTILQGIPLDVRDLRVNLDRPNFMLNPTSCEAMRVDSLITSTQGATANPSVHFQLADCAALGFKPKMALRLFGKTRRGAYPKFRAILMPRRGDANASKVSVTLPPSQFLANNHIKAPCTRADFAADNCPRASIYGFAKAWSPLLDRPLTGPVYLKTSNNKLPDLAVSLRGPAYQPIRIDAIGRVDSIKFPNGNTGIRNTFTVVPDAPISKFMLTMKGGGKGLLQNSTNICKGTHRASVKMDAHNGRIRDIRPKVKAACGKKGKRKKSKKHSR